MQELFLLRRLYCRKCKADTLHVLMSDGRYRCLDCFVQDRWTTRFKHKEVEAGRTSLDSDFISAR